MAVLDIKAYPDKILSKKASPVKNIGKKEEELAFDMIETMHSAGGIGLAAPQVDVDRRMIVIESFEENKEPYVFINPVIVKKSGRSSFCEGCLSIPGMTADVIRPERITMEAMDLKGRAIRIETSGLLARVIQHEADHLDGILFIDRVGFFKRKKILKQISSKVCVEL